MNIIGICGHVHVHPLFICTRCLPLTECIVTSHVPDAVRAAALLPVAAPCDPLSVHHAGGEHVASSIPKRLQAGSAQHGTHLTHHLGHDDGLIEGKIETTTPLAWWPS
jgi:hypothetical protein